ncbi:MAG: hypothetical protein LBV02_05690 [Bacteroidales bacterium]|jgi:hypothetical protein|nr:hypothetical protein [Bacteroidales bacterium]
MKKTKYFLPLLIPAFFLCACEPQLQYSIIPEITEYTGFEYYIDEYFNSPKGTLSFTFTDGDGDVGLSEADTMSPFDRNSEYHYNLYIFYYEKQHGEFVKIETSQPLHTRIPMLSNYTPESIEVKFSIDLDLNPFSEFDTIQLEFFIYDRELHKSNVIVTPELVLPREKNSGRANKWISRRIEE